MLRPHEIKFASSTVFVMDSNPTRDTLNVTPSSTVTNLYCRLAPNGEAHSLDLSVQNDRKAAA